MLNPVSKYSEVSTDRNTSKKRSFYKVDEISKSEDVKISIGEKPFNSPIYKKPHINNNSNSNFAQTKVKKFLNPLKKLIVRIVFKQSNIVDMVENKHPFKLNKEDIEKANYIISENGDLGINSSSDLIVEFSEAFFQGNASEIDEIKQAVDSGFKYAEELLGELPQICKSTYNAVIKKLYEWKLF